MEVAWLVLEVLMRRNNRQALVTQRQHEVVCGIIWDEFVGGGRDWQVVSGCNDHAAIS